MGSNIGGVSGGVASSNCPQKPVAVANLRGGHIPPVPFLPVAYVYSLSFFVLTKQKAKESDLPAETLLCYLVGNLYQKGSQNQSF